MDTTNPAAAPVAGNEAATDNSQLESASNEQSDIVTEDSSKETDKSLPFHKHPRWIERNKELKQTRESLAEREAKIQEYESKIKSLEAASKTLDKQPATKEQDSSVSGLSKELDGYFEGLPEPELKDKYETMPELYKDLRKSIYRDLLLASRRDEEKRSSVEAQNQAQISQQYKDIIEEIGSESEDDFRSYVQKALDKAKEVGKQVDLSSIYIAYLNSDYQKEGEVGTKKPAAKINKSGRAAVTPTSRQLTQKELDKLDMHQLARLG